VNSNSRLIQIALTAITLLLLGFVGFTTLQNGNNLAQLEQILLASATDAVPSESPATETTQEPGLETPTPPPTNDASDVADVADLSSTDTDVEQASETPTVNAATILTATTPEDVASTVLLTSMLPEVQIQLSTSSTVDATDVKARLLILKRILSDSSTESLAAGITSSEETLAAFDGAPANLTLKFATLPPSGDYEGRLIITGSGIPPTSQKLTVNVINFTEKSGSLAEPAKVSIRLPTVDDASLFATTDHPQVDFRLENLSAVDNLKVNTQLIITQNKSGTDETLFSPGYATTAEEVSLPSFGTVNVTLDLTGRLPPGGSYEAWLVVNGENIQLAAKKVTLTIAGSPQKTIQYRAEAGGAAAEKIMISAIRPHPWSNTVIYDAYSLVVWETNNQPVGNWSVLSSELADKTNGHSAFLTIEKDSLSSKHRLDLSPDSPAQPVSASSISVKLGLAGIEHPGSYDGKLQIINSDLFQNQSIPVKVQVRDTLWAPMLLIFFASLGIGVLLRYSDVIGSKNLSALRYRLTVVRDLLQRKNIIKTNPNLYWTIKVDLDHAEVLLIIGDSEVASNKIDDAYEKLGFPESEARINVAEPYFEMRDPFSPEYYPVSGAVVGYQGQTLFFKLKGASGTNAVTCKINKEAIPTNAEFECSYLPPRKGTYRLTAENQKEEICSLLLNIRSDPAGDARNRVARIAIIATVAWAAVATVAGLIYIQAYLPTFGSTTDYLLALAWALGLSTASRPTENFAASFFSFLNKAKDPEEGQAPPADLTNVPAGSGQPETMTVPQIPQTTNRKKAEDLLRDTGLQAAFAPPDAGDDWLVDSTEPQAGAKVNKGSPVTCKMLKPTTNEEETTDEEAGSSGNLDAKKDKE